MSSINNGPIPTQGKYTMNNIRKRYGFREPIPLLQDNLDGKLQAGYQDTFLLEDNSLCCYYPPDYNGYLTPPDYGTGEKIKH